MKAIMVMFDSLNRRFLPPYGCDWIHAPISRAWRNGRPPSTTAMPAACRACRRGARCTPGATISCTARGGHSSPSTTPFPRCSSRRASTRIWSPTTSTIGRTAGRPTTTATVPTSSSAARKATSGRGSVPAPGENPAVPERDHPAGTRTRSTAAIFADQADHPQTKVFDAGLEFIETNCTTGSLVRADRDVRSRTSPSSPTSSTRPTTPDPTTDPARLAGIHGASTEPPETVQHARDEYAALLSMCDASLGRVLDPMDELDLWDDTMLIVCTDHGFLLGEHGWWAKMVSALVRREHPHAAVHLGSAQPGKGTARKALVQTIDFGPTLLDFFGLEPTPEMEGRRCARTMPKTRRSRSRAVRGLWWPRQRHRRSICLHARAEGPYQSPAVRTHADADAYAHAFHAGEIEGRRAGSAISLHQGRAVLAHAWAVRSAAPTRSNPDDAVRP